MKTPSKLNHIAPPLRFLILMTLTVLTVRAFAQEDRSRTESPYFFVISSEPGLDRLPLKKTSAQVTISGVIADVVVTQEYRNEGTSPLEAIYTFPASTNAAVYALEMVVGDRRIKAKIEERAKAREEYEEAKASGKRASLLEQHRPNVFQMNVSNIMPGDKIKVVLRYTELLIPEEGTYSFVYPTVVGPRYSGESTNNASVSFVSNPHTKKGTLTTYSYDMDVHLSAGMPIQHLSCQTHHVQKSFNTPTSASIKLAPTETTGGDRDFVLTYKLAGNTVESGLLLYEHGDENFFLLMVQPPKRVLKEEIPPREYIFIVDVSGSMHGFPINTSKTLLRNLVVNLRPTDRFNILVFESGAYWLSDESVPATLENVAKAGKFLDNQQGGGGTNMLSAMQKALSFPRSAENLSRSFVVVTDGYVSVEKQVFDIIRTKADKANVFAFGIGSSVNRFLIEGMSRAAQSEPFIVLDPEHADLEAEKFRRYVNTPVLTNVKKTFTGFDAYDVEPISIPDVLSERPVVIFGKYRGKSEGSITIEGTSGNKKYKKVFRVADHKADPRHGALRYLWARKKVQMLDDYNNMDSSPEITQRITSIGLRYNLLTAYTSFIAVEEKPARHGKELTTVKQALPMPQHVENSAIGFDLEVEDDEEVSFHKELRIAQLGASQKSRVQSHIEKNVLKTISRYLSEQGVSLNSIEVIVGMDGLVVEVKISGTGMSEKHRADLERIIRGPSYERFRLYQVWKYSILF